MMQRSRVGATLGNLRLRPSFANRSTPDQSNLYWHKLPRAFAIRLQPHDA